MNKHQIRLPLHSESVVAIVFSQTYNENVSTSVV